MIAHLRLGSLLVQLESPDAAILAHWRALFGGWLLDAPPAGTTPHLHFHARLAPRLPTLPPTPPYFSHPLGLLDVYAADNDNVWLHFPPAGLVHLPLNAPAGGAPVPLHATLTPATFAHGLFEDLNFVSLAPWLRRHGCFLVHAFGVSRQGQATLLVGPSGSGKTTTGLNMVLAGWQLLGNDVVLLQARPGGIHALPTPGEISIRPHTLTLLPALRSFLPADASPTATAQSLSRTGPLATHPAGAEPVRHILFPKVTQQPQSQLRPQSAALTLAHLAAESIDRWDTAAFIPHLDLLSDLSRQVHSYDLALGADVASLPQQIEQLLT